MAAPLFPAPSRELSSRRHNLAPGVDDAFRAFSERVFADGALDAKTKQLIAVAVAHATQCPYCIQSHTKLALRAGALPEQLMEAIWVATEMRAGGAFAHANIALTTLADEEARTRGTPAP
jgi:AhpD family alkylhydroperoxidase